MVKFWSFLVQLDLKCLFLSPKLWKNHLQKNTGCHELSIHEERNVSIIETISVQNNRFTFNKECGLIRVIFFPIDVGKVRKIIIDRTACWPTPFNQARGPIPSSLWSIFWLYNNVSERYLERKDFFMSMQAFCFWKNNVPRVTDCRLCVWSRFWWANKIKNNIEKIQRERENKQRKNCCLFEQCVEILII